MYDTERNMHHPCIHDNFLIDGNLINIHLEEKKQVLQCTNSIMLFVKRNFHIGYVRLKSSSCFKHQINITVVSLSYGSLFH